MSLGGLYLEGPIHGRAYFRNFSVCQNRSFYFSWCQRLLVLMTFHPPFYKLHTCMRVSLLSGRPLFDWYFSSTGVVAWNRVKMAFDVMFNPQWFCFARKHKSVQHGNQTVHQTSLGAFLLNNTNFSTGAHVPAPQYDHYLTQAVDSCFILTGLISMA